MAGSTVANKAGGFWLGTFVFAFIEVAFILFVRKTGVKGQNGCVAQRARGSRARVSRRCGSSAACTPAALRAAPHACGNTRRCAPQRAARTNPNHEFARRVACAPRCAHRRLKFTLYTTAVFCCWLMCVAARAAGARMRVSPARNALPWPRSLKNVLPLPRAFHFLACRWGILYMAQMNPLINPILGE
jgi:hypothetical protein